MILEITYTNHNDIEELFMRPIFGYHDTNSYNYIYDTGIYSRKITRDCFELVSEDILELFRSSGKRSVIDEKSGLTYHLDQTCGSIIYCYKNSAAEVKDAYNEALELIKELERNYTGHVQFLVKLNDICCADIGPFRAKYKVKDNYIEIYLSYINRNYIKICEIRDQLNQ
jgi:hypothetical protein